MAKIWNIAFKDIRLTFTDRNLILIMLVTPLVLSTIIALAFSDIASTTGGFDNIPIALVNLDEGAEDGQNNGQIFVNLLAPDAASENGNDNSTPTCEVTPSEQANAATDQNQSASLETLTETTLFETAAAARQGVDDGDYVAAIIIPADFSQRLAYTPGVARSTPVAVEIYADANRSISGSIIRSIIESIVNQIVTGNITISATVDTIIEQGRTPQFDNTAFACAFTGAFNTVDLAQESTGSGEFNPLVLFGSSQAMFFALFTAAGAAANILQERREGTLQRMIVSPTPRLHILLGKLLGIFAVVLLQLTFLFIAFTLVASLLEGEMTFIWGQQWLLIMLLVFAASLAASSIGMVTGALGKTPEQVNIIGGIIAMVMGVLGGAFFSVDALGSLEPITRISIVRWGAEAFTILADGGTDVWINVLALLLIGGGLFFISIIVFSRRQDV